MNVIYDNIIFFLQKSGGGSVYWYELIKRAIIAKKITPLFSEPAGKTNNKLRSTLKLKVHFVEKIPLSLLRVINSTIPIKEKSIFHSSYYRISNSKRVINIVTIHDFTSELFFTGIRKFVHTKRKKKAIYKAKGIICISEHTKKDLLRLYPNIDEKKIKVIYNGVSNDYFILPKTYSPEGFRHIELLREKYILFIGHRTNYKNFDVAVSTVALCNQNTKFIIIGESLSKKELAKLEKQLKNRYKCLTGLNNESLNILYNYAHCLIYPSSYEGFGIPIIEAMSAGCPVVTTNKSSIPEVADNAAIIVDEISATKFANAIEQLDNKQFRTRIIERGIKRSSFFSWDKSANEVFEFYNTVYGNSK